MTNLLLRRLSALCFGLLVSASSFPQAYDLLVSSFSAGAVLRYGAEDTIFRGEFIRQSCGNLGMVYGIAVGPDGLVYLPDYDHHRVMRYSRTGLFVDEFVPTSSGGLTEPIFCAFGPDGNLYVTGYFPGVVYRFDGVTGDPLPAPSQTGAVFVPSGTLDVGDNRGGPLAFGPDGNLYAISWAHAGPGGVIRFDASTGDFMDVFVADGANQANSWAFTFGPDGNLYVGDYSSACSIWRYSGTDGSFIDEFVSHENGVGAIYAIAFGPDNNLYATSLGFEGGDDAVRRFSGDTGALIDVFIPTGSGGLTDTTGLAFKERREQLYGDADDNGCVDDADITEVILAFGESCCCPADVTRDGVVDDADITVVILNFGDGC